MRGEKISKAEPVSELRGVRIRENGEPLVDFLKLCPDLWMDRPRFHYRRETMVRQSVAEKLCAANASLMGKGYRLLIYEGWRAPLIQRRMYGAIWKQFKDKFPDRSDTSLRRIVNQFSAPMSDRVPPPHTTGAAVDVMIADLEGNALDMQSPFASYDHASYPFDAPGLSESARRHRDLMGDALRETGLTNYPSEYWHWSYGDQGWAYRGGHEFALYKAIEPSGWEPDPKDVTDDPLEFIV